ncbi:MAG TPA: transketolase [Acidimicrobiales bacterium]
MVDEIFHGADELEGRTIRNISAAAMDAPAAANSGHSGTAMALAPLATMLFTRVLRHDPSDPSWPDRDRFILSCGHVSILQYSLAHFFGYDLSVDDLREFRQAHSRTPGHPEVGLAPTVEVTTGPLGQGIANGVGMAIAERLLRATHGEDLVNHRTWVIASDGCLEEGISHEAASLAGSLGLDRLTIMYDDNHITIDGKTELALHDDPAERFAAYGWQVINVGEDANDLDVLEGAVREAMADTGRPTLIIIRSHIAFPSPTMMDRREAHGSPFSPEAIAEAKAILGMPNVPFELDDELPSLNRARVLAKDDLSGPWRERLHAAAERGERLVAQLADAGALREPVTFETYEGGTKVATRKAMQRAMDTFAAFTPGLTTGSADLTDNTGVTLKSSTIQNREDHAGRQFHYGIREHAMGAVMVGQALHGGIRPAGSTFFVFSDYERPAIRLASLSHAGVLFVFTHDSVGVGEDGPTHQPVEHLMALRAMPRLHVLRPSDANEAVRLIEAYLRDPAPATTALILTRQDIPVMAGADAEASASNAHRGGYVVRENAAARYSLVGTGSEVALCLAACDALATRGIATRVVALPCWRCFDAQDASYRASVLRRDVPSVSLEAGATLGWCRFVDDALGIDEFGMSAPAPAVFEHFHINSEALVDFVSHRLEVSS